MVGHLYLEETFNIFFLFLEAVSDVCLIGFKMLQNVILNVVQEQQYPRWWHNSERVHVFRVRAGLMRWESSNDT